MALSREEVLDLFLSICTKETIGQRMTQMYQVLTTAQQNAAFNAVKSDVLEKLNEIKEVFQNQDVSLEAQLTATNTQIDDVTDSS